MSNGEETKATPERFEREWRRVILALAAAGLASSLLYAAQFGRVTFLRVTALSVVVAGAAILAGGILGFLFGVPFTRPGEQPSKDETTYRPNTSLEQVSDWLTKIIVGIGLVQIGRAPRALSSLAEALGPAFSPPSASGALAPGAEAFSLGLVLYFAIAGFLGGFLWARLSLPRAFHSADLVKQINELRVRQEELDAKALTLLERALTPDPGGSAPSESELKDVLGVASAPVRVQVFNRTRAFRRENTDVVRRPPEVERTVPVFRALIAVDTSNKYHRNHAQLGYALMEVPDPRYADAVQAFSDAIRLRGDWRTSGFLLYEYCRAFCRIQIDLAAPPGREEDAALRSQVIEDAAAVASVPDLFRQFVVEEAVQQWLTARELTADDLTDGAAPPS